MPLLEEYEQRQSGVRRILRELETLREGATRQCCRRQGDDPVRDAVRTEGHRATLALLMALVDRIEGVEDTEEDMEGIG